MKLPPDPYGHEQRYDAAKRNLEAASNIKSADKQAILSFTRELLLNNITKARATKYLYHLTVLARNKKPTFNDCTRKDIEKLVDWLNTQHYSDYTRSEYLVVLKRFFQCLRGCDPNEHEYPGEVKWIRVRRKRKRILPETLLTREDIKRLLDATENTRDRALVITHYESGCRIGEILSLRIQNIQFDQQGAVLIVNGKTGTRRVRIVSAKTALAEWLSIHPKRNDPANYAWIGIGTVGRYKPLNYESVRRIYRNLTKRARLAKRVYTHLFRHTRAHHNAHDPHPPRASQIRCGTRSRTILNLLAVAFASQGLVLRGRTVTPWFKLRCSHQPTHLCRHVRESGVHSSRGLLTS